MNKKIILLFIVSFIYSVIFAQDTLKQYSHTTDTIIHYGYKNVPFQMLNGYIILVNGDTLNGYFSIRTHNFYPYHDHCLFWKAGNPNPLNIPYKKIRYIQTNIRSLGRNFTEIKILKMKHSGGKFWRIIKEKGDIIIYDQCFGLFFNEPWNSKENDVSKNEFSDNMFMVKRENQVKIYGRLSGFFKKRYRSNEFILKFINKRYHLSLQQSDFKSGMDMLDYILDKESKN